MQNERLLLLFNVKPSHIEFMSVLRTGYFLQSLNVSHLQSKILIANSVHALSNYIAEILFEDMQS